MNPWTPIYVIAGAWAIFAIVWAIALDALELARWWRDWSRDEIDFSAPPPPIMGRGRYVAAIAILIALWLAAAILR